MDAKVEVKGSNIFLHGVTRNTPQWRMVCSWPGWRPSFDTLMAPIWPSTVLPLTRPMTSLRLRFSDEATLAARKAAESIRRAKAALFDPATPGLWYPTARKPLPHQVTALEALKLHGWCAMLNDEMGLGKTATALWAMHEARAKQVLIICPATVKWNWLREIGETIGMDNPIFVYSGTAQDRAETTAQLIWALDEGLPVHVVINYDLLQRLPADQMQAIERSACGLILDEAHYVKSPKAQRTKLVRQIAEHADYRIALTGTPIRNYVDDLFTQVDIIRPGTWTSYNDFCERHAVITTLRQGPRTIRKIVGGKNLTELNEVVSTVQIRRCMDEVLDLPPKIYTYPTLELDEPTRKLYDEMRTHAVYALDALDPSALIFSPQAASGMAALMRCEQLAQGFLGGLKEPWMEKLNPLALKSAERIQGRPAELIFPGSSKLAWLTETIDSLLCEGKLVTVYSNFNGPLVWLQKKYGEQCTVLHGGVPAAQRDSILEAFREGKVKLLACQIKIAEGFNLTHCHDELFLGVDWSPAINQQAEARCHRIGTKGTVHIQVPVVLGTIETYMHRKLRAKNEDAEQALRSITVEEIKNELNR